MTSINQARAYRDRWGGHTTAFLDAMLDRMDNVRSVQQRLMKECDSIPGLSEAEALALLAAVGTALCFVEVVRGELEVQHESSGTN